VELRHLRYFVAVAEELHFGRAALRLGMAQPPLSQQIRRLEAEIGITLFSRTKRHVELTDAGRAFLDHARAILLQAEQAVQAAQRAQPGRAGRLAVGFAPWADFSILPPLIRTFGARHPDVQLQVLELNAPDQIRALRDERIQVAFLRPPVHDRSLTVERIVTERLVVAFPSGHRLEAWRRVPLKRLADEPHIVVPRQRAPVYHDLVTRFCRDMGFTVRPRHEIDHPHGVLSLVAAGLGISLVPASALTNERDGVHHRPLAPAGPAVELVVAWRRAQRSPQLHAFLDVVRDHARAIRRRGARDAAAIRHDRSASGSRPVNGQNR
jgi:DNA-binding transcriptional LysR family regulator